MINRNPMKIFFVILIFFSNRLFFVSAETDYLYLYPSTYTASEVNEEFTLELRVENVEDMAGYVTAIVWDPKYIEMIEFEFEDFLSKHGLTLKLDSPINNNLGRIPVITEASMFAEYIDGSGTLATLKFKIKQEVVETKIELANYTLQKAGTQMEPKVGNSIINLSKEGSLIAFAGEDITINEGIEVTLDASESDGEIDTYNWSFYDNNTLKNLTGERPKYTFNIPSNYKINLTVTDGELTSDDTVNIIVLDKTPPVLKFFSYGVNTTNPIEGNRVYFNASESHDPETNNRLELTWNFGDGNKGEGYTSSNIYDKAGKYTISLQGIDDAGNSNTYSEEITIMKRERVGSTNIPIWIIGILVIVTSLSLYGTISWLRS